MLTSRFRILIAVCAALMTLGALLTPAAAAPPGPGTVPEGCEEYWNYDNGRGRWIPFKSERECARYVNKGGTLQLLPTVTITYAGSRGACDATVTVRNLPDGQYQPAVYYSIGNQETGSWEDQDVLWGTQPSPITVSDNIGAFTFVTNGAYSDPEPSGVFIYHEVIIAGVSSGQVPVMGCAAE